MIEASSESTNNLQMAVVSTMLDLSPVTDTDVKDNSTFPIRTISSQSSFDRAGKTHN